VNQILDRQRVTLEHYARDPDLLSEHVGMEDNFEAGGYGERQVPELLQNAVDQLAEPGRVEFRLASGVLYCANEGNPFTSDGIRAIAGAFLSSKTDDQIGRFGLGFKSVLGVSNCPQVLSRSIAFGFNDPQAAQLLEALPYATERVPALRVPSIIDADTIAASDGDLDELMGWATTVIRLPLVRGGDRIREELARFDSRYLLFTPNLAQVEVSLGEPDGSLTRKTYRRINQEGSQDVALVDPDGTQKPWRVLTRRHGVSDTVARESSKFSKREVVTVSYALEQGAARSATVGRFWAWFPLRDETTASGIFNAPWDVNDDRTSMLPASKLNAELLEVAAELLLEAVALESTPEDPARHLDILPARGKEARSPADRYMSERLPQLARKIPLIPTAAGTLSGARTLEVPIIDGPQNPFQLPDEIIRLWTAVNSSPKVPHWSCYRTATRAARLQQLLSDEGGTPVCATIEPARWLESIGTPIEDAKLTAVLQILTLAKAQSALWAGFGLARVLPLEDGTMARALDASSLVFPAADGSALPDVPTIAANSLVDAAARTSFRELGVRDPSPDSLAAAAASAAGSDWSDDQWARFWRLLADSTRAGGTSVIESILQRNLEVKLPTKAGEWRGARNVCVDSQHVAGLTQWSLDMDGIGARTDLARVAGALEGMKHGYPVTDESIWTPYLKAMQRLADEALTRERGATARGALKFEEIKGLGPLDILAELDGLATEDAAKARAWWSEQIVQEIDEPMLAVAVHLRDGERIFSQVLRPEIWAVKTHGLVPTTLGLRRPKDAVGRQLGAFGQFLPVAAGPEWDVVELPTTLDRVSTRALKNFMALEDYKVANTQAFHDVLSECAERQPLANSSRVPAISSVDGTVVLCAVADVVSASESALADTPGQSFHYIPDGPGIAQIRQAWRIPTLEDVVSKHTDWISAGEPVTLEEKYPSLRAISDALPANVTLRRCDEITRRVAGPSGVISTPLSCHLDGQELLVLVDLDDEQTLACASSLLALTLSPSDITAVLKRDRALRYSNHIQRVAQAPTHEDKLLALVGRDNLARQLPDGLLDVFEHRQGALSDFEIAELFLNTHGNDALRELRDTMAALQLEPPRNWSGSAETEEFVRRLGFPRQFAGSRSRRVADVELIPGNVELKALHAFQQDLANQITELVSTPGGDADHRRALLYLPTGAGKTRVTTESLALMMRENTLKSPVLWIAQSSELCEQAIVSWTEVWRALGDERPLEVCRYLEQHEVDESQQELQVVIATDDKLHAMIGDDVNRGAHEWLRQCGIVVVDEAHRAGSPTYTEILRWLGITAGQGAKTERPLLGLTATPFRGRNVDENRRLVARFGGNLLNALDESDPIGQLRDMQVLARVEHQVLEGISVPDDPQGGASGVMGWNDISRAVLRTIGSNLNRTEMLVEHVTRQDQSWPILIFTPSVVSAHVTAALLRAGGHTADAVDGSMRPQERRRKIEEFRDGTTQILVNCDLLTQGFDAPKVRALYVARPTFSPNRYIQMVGRGLRGPLNGGTAECLVVNVADTFTQFNDKLAFHDFDYLWERGAKT